MIMRYQRISPDSVPVSNGRRTNSPSNPNWKNCKKEEDKVEMYGNLYMKTSSSTFEAKGPSKFRSPSRNSQDHQISNNGSNTTAAEHPNSPPPTTTTTNTNNINAARNQQNLESNNGVGGGGGGGWEGGGETFLQWGHRKRSRCSRGITMADDTSSSTTSGAAQLQSAKIQRRSSATQLSSSSSPNAYLMPPPPPSLPSNANEIIHRGSSLKTQARNTSSTLRRNLEERSQSGGGSKSISGRSRAAKRTPFLDKKSPCASSSRDDKKMNGCSLQHNQEGGTSAGNHLLSPPPQQQVGSGSMNMNDDTKLAAGAVAGGGGGGGEKGNAGGGEVNEWPRIYIALSRKEKEEDFLAMKGTKLPHRPKKRPKAIDRIIQYCYPGMWLSDLSKSRYEVREKKCPRKQKRRGLKGMESMESDSE